MPRIFISYSKADRPAALRLRNRIEALGFETPFIDIEIKAGTQWERELYVQLERCLAVLFHITPNWRDSEFCFAEYIQARILGKPIVKVLVAGDDQPEIAWELQHVDLRTDWDGGFERLRDALERIRDASQAGFAFPPGRSPYPGGTFEAEDAAVYFGRDEEIHRLSNALRARRSQGGSRLVVVLGASGSGKSSLLRAGVLPRLAREPEQWLVLGPIRPGPLPATQLTLAVQAALSEASGGSAPADIEAFGKLLRTDAKRAVEKLGLELRWRSGRQRADVLIAIDQGEELFSQADAEERALFLGFLSALAATNAQVVGVMTFRSDFLGQLQSAHELTGDFLDFKLNPLPVERFPSIIRGPAAVVGLHIDEELVLRASRDAPDGSVLPLLAFALSDLYQRHGKSGALTLADYTALGDQSAGLGSLENSVRRRAEETLAEIKPSAEQLASLRRSFIPALVRVDAEGRYARRTARWEVMPSAAQPLLERLIDSRLLNATDRDGERVVEVSHEALLRHWPMLRGWLDDERDLLVGLDQLQRDLADWQRQAPKHRSQALLTGLKLSRARNWMARSADAFSEELRTFIETSAAAADRTERQRVALRRRILLGSLGAAAALAVAASVAGWQSWVAGRERDQALASLLVARSQQALADDRIFDAARDTYRALSVKETYAVRSATVNALLRLHPQLRRRSQFLEGVPLRLAHSETGDLTLLINDSGRVFTLDRNTLTTRPWSGTDARAQAWVAFSRVGGGGRGVERLVLLDQSGRLWRMEVPAAPEVQTNGAVDPEPFPLLPEQQWIEVADLHADAGLIAFVGEGDRHAHILRCDLDAWPLALSRCDRIDGPEGRFAKIAIDPSGRHVAFGTEDGHVLVQVPAKPDEILSVSAEGEVSALAWDSAGRWLGMTFRDAHNGSSKLVALDTERQLTIGPLTVPWTMARLAWSEGADSLAGPCDERGRVLCVWSREGEQLRLRHRLTGHRERITDIGWVPGGLLSVGLDRELLVWGLGRPAEGWSMLTASGPELGFTDIAAAPIGNQLAVGTDVGTVELFDLGADAVRTVLLTGHPDAVAALAWSANGRRLAAADDGGGVFAWEPPTTAPMLAEVVSSQRIEAVVLSADGRRLFVPLRDGRGVAGVELKGEGVRYSDGNPAAADMLGLSAVPGAPELLAVDVHGRFSLYSTQTLGRLAHFAPPADMGRGIARDELDHSHDGKAFFAVGNDKLVLIGKGHPPTDWHALTLGDVAQIQDVAISGDDAMLAALANDNTLRVWSAPRGSAFDAVHPYLEINLAGVAVLDPEGWRGADQKWLRTEKLCWLPNGHRLAVSTAAGKAIVIDLDRGAWRRRLANLLGEVPRRETAAFLSGE